MFCTIFLQKACRINSVCFYLLFIVKTFQGNQVVFYPFKSLSFNLITKCDMKDISLSMFFPLWVIKLVAVCYIHARMYVLQHIVFSYQNDDTI